MKKIVLALFVAFIATGLSAFELVSIDSIEYSTPIVRLLDGGINIEVFPTENLYKDLSADHFYPGTSVQFATMEDGFGPEFILGEQYDVDGQNQYPIKKNSQYLFIKVGFSQSLFRFSSSVIPGFQVEGMLQGMLNTTFIGGGGMDNLGFDGIYFYGIVCSLTDAVQIRFGKHHFSGHYSDEILYPFITAATQTLNEDLVEYTRDNSYLLGISINPIPQLRLYGEAELPEHESWLRPFFHRPDAFYEKGGPGWWMDFYRDDNPYGDEYAAWRLQAGAEIELELPIIGTVYAAGDVQFYQSGQSEHWGEGFDSDNPWENGYTLTVGKVFTNKIAGRYPKISYVYHSGRFPLLNYFYHRDNYTSIMVTL
jgi:hypothetical protein